MKVLLITNNLQGMDGWSKYSLLLIEEMISAGHQVLVVVNAFSENNSIRQEVALEEPYRYVVNPFTVRRGAQAVQKIIQEFSPDVLHVLVEPYVNILPFVLIPKKIKVFLTIHGTFSYPPNTVRGFFKKNISRKLFLSALKKVNSIISVSSFTRNYFLENILDGKIPPVTVIPNGVKVPEFTERAKTAVPKILFVGAVKTRKGIREAIRSLRYYHDNYSKNFFYTIVGEFNEDDPYFKEVKKDIERCGLEEKVIFKGRVSNDALERHYRESDLFMLLPVNEENRFEGFGLVYLEANARGIPVIGGRDSGAIDAIHEGKSGYLVDSQSPEDVALAIDKILNRHMIKSMDCRTWAMEHSIDKVTKQVFSLYNSNE